MPVRKKLSHRTILGRLLASDKLSEAERKAFEAMDAQTRNGAELTEHQQLWIETLRPRIDA